MARPGPIEGGMRITPTSERCLTNFELLLALREYPQRNLVPFETQLTAYLQTTPAAHLTRAELMELKQRMDEIPIRQGEQLHYMNFRPTAESVHTVLLDSAYTHTPQPVKDFWEERLRGLRENAPASATTATATVTAGTLTPMNVSTTK